MVVDSAKADLSDFFSAWGYLKPINVSIEDYSTAQMTITTSQSNATLQYIKNKNFDKLPYKIQYITDTNWQLYKNKTTVEAGSAALFGNSMRMTGWKNAVAFEAWQGSSLVAISQTQQISFPGNYTDSTKIYAIQYDGTRTEVVPQLSVIPEAPKLSNNDIEYWYVVKNMGQESTNSHTNRSFASLTAGSSGTLAGASTLPVLRTPKWKLVDVSGKTGLVNESGVYLGSDLNATTTPTGWTLENVTQGGSSGYRFAQYTGNTLTGVAHLSNSLSLINYTENDAASVWQFVPADAIIPSIIDNVHFYIITSMRVDPGIIGSRISYNSTDNTVNIHGGSSVWNIVNYNTTTGACNLICEGGKYLTTNGSALTLSDTPRTFYIYVTSFEGIAGYRISLGNYSGSPMLSMTSTGALTTSTSLTSGSLWQFLPVVITGTTNTTVNTPTIRYSNGSLEIDNEDNFQIYNLQGQKLTNNNLPRGIYLIRTSTNSFKYVHQ